MQVQHADPACAYLRYVPVPGALCRGTGCPSAADLDLAMPVIGLLDAGAQSNRGGGNDVMEAAGS
jgi:hypothetical protein